MPFVGGRRIDNASLRYGKTATDVMQRETHVLVENATVSSLTGAFFPEFGSGFSLLVLLKCRLLVGDALIKVSTLW